MKELVRQVRSAETMIGKGKLGMEDCERENAPLIRRSIAARIPLQAGHTISQDDLIWVRPGDGIPPGKEDTVVGKTLNAALNAGDRFQPAQLAWTHVRDCRTYRSRDARAGTDLGGTERASGNADRTRRANSRLARAPRTSPCCTPGLPSSISIAGLTNHSSGMI